MQPPKHPDEEERTANDLLWLATHTPYDATGLLDRALGSGATALWDAIADQIRRVDQGNLSSLGRGEALVAAVALAKSRPNGAAKPASALAGEIRDPMIARVLGAPSAERTEEPMIGEMTAAPRGPLATAVLALTGVLFLWRASALLARLALAYRQPAEVTLGDGGVRIRWRVELLGRPLRDRDILLPHGSLVRATRELRYPRLPLYAGLIALAVGSYVGVSAFVDGVRTASPSLLATGIAIVALGLVLDFVLSSAVPGARARCRLIFVSRTGTKLCVGNVDVRQADTLLARLAKR
jgi:hypothetical protein